MKRKKTSPIWIMPKDQFEKLIKSKYSCAEVLECFGLSKYGNNWQTVKRRCREDGIDFSHFRNHADANRHFANKNLTPLSEALIENSTYSRCHLKKRLIADGILENKCAVCGLPPEWNCKPLVLRLDHINGTSDDNRLFNLRLVCPNCDSQLPTFAGRNVKRTRRNCIDCGQKLSYSKGVRCMSCNFRYQVSSNKRCKITWPAPEEIIEEITSTSQNAMARRLGISEAALRKRIKSLKRYELWPMEDRLSR